MTNDAFNFEQAVDRGLYTEAQLKALTIHDLRIILKRMGGTPSNKKSGILVNEILYIQNGGVPEKNSNRGRKPKFVKNDAIISQNDMVVADIPILEKKINPYKINFENFNWRKAPTCANGVFAPIKTVCSTPGALVERVAVADGVLVADAEPPYVINYDAHFSYPVYKVERGLVVAYGLRTGDKITGYARGVDGGRFTVYEIEKINDVLKTEFVRGESYKTLPAAYPRERFILGNGSFACRAVDLFAPIGKGSRVAIIEDGKRSANKIITSILSQTENAAHVIDLPIGFPPEGINDITEDLVKAEVAGSDFCADAAEALSTVYIYLERAKRLLEQGETVVVAIRGLDKLFAFLQEQHSEEGESPIIELKKILALTRSVKEGGSLTLICSFPKKHCAELDEVGPLFNCCVRLSESSFFDFGGVDIFASTTTGAEKMCDEAELFKIERLRSLLFEKDNPEFFAQMLKQSENNEEIRQNLDKYIKILSD